MRKSPFLIFSLFYAISSCVNSAPSLRKDIYDSEFAKSSDFYAAIVNNAFESKYRFATVLTGHLSNQKHNLVFFFVNFLSVISGSGMKICPKIYASTSPSSKEDISSYLIEFDSNTAKRLETCCSSNIQCDAQTRSQLKGVTIEADVRHCECEREFRDCISSVNVPSALWWGDFYFRHTPTCYSMDHPIVKCEQYKCFYQPKKQYKYPKRHRHGAVRCVKYKLDKSKPKVYQTFELPFYYAAYDSDGYEFLNRLAIIFEKSHN